jgi:hypothetical protein
MPRKALEDLHTHLENAAAADESQRDRVNALKQRVEQAMEKSESHPQFMDELEQAAVQFGEEHPELAAAIRAAIAILGEGGV